MLLILGDKSFEKPGTAAMIGYIDYVAHRLNINKTEALYLLVEYDWSKERIEAHIYVVKAVMAYCTSCQWDNMFWRADCSDPHYLACLEAHLDLQHMAGVLLPTCPLCCTFFNPLSLIQFLPSKKQ
ncbi:unnamed protein product [Arabis nemorensis]|uniref:Uncharacterized protein n=1 Tax=Arabis nemorensis TaxID=586526 RepID=A0A565BL55_9BRAS|nr:unnamed protein product [Arabis nemorensis]